MKWEGYVDMEGDSTHLLKQLPTDRNQKHLARHTTRKQSYSFWQVLNRQIKEISVKYD